MTGFAWYFLAHTQHDYLPVIQIADLGGAYAVTFLVAAVNAMLFEWLCRMARFRRWLFLREPAVPPRRWKLVLQSATVLALLIGTLFYGLWRLGQDEFAAGPRIALIQSNLDQRLRNTAVPGNNAAQRMVVHNRELTDRAAQDAAGPDHLAGNQLSRGLGRDIAGAAAGGGPAGMAAPPDRETRSWPGWLRRAGIPMCCWA